MLLPHAVFMSDLGSLDDGSFDFTHKVYIHTIAFSFTALFGRAHHLQH